MGRQLRIEYPGAVYHITSRGNERSDILRDDSDRLKFLDMLVDYQGKYVKNKGLSPLVPSGHSPNQRDMDSSRPVGEGLFV